MNPQLPLIAAGLAPFALAGLYAYAQNRYRKHQRHRPVGERSARKPDRPDPGETSKEPSW